MAHTLGGWPGLLPPATKCRTPFQLSERSTAPYQWSRTTDVPLLLPVITIDGMCTRLTRQPDYLVMARAWSLWLLIVLSTGSSFVAAEPLRRHMDNRAPVNVQAVEKNGIRGYSSNRLLLYTDIAPEKARQLVRLVDEVYDDWEVQFGPLPEARDRTQFQITGYLMKDAEKFRRTNLLRRDPKSLIHGQNEGYEFWMHDQGTDYYRAHLLLHEATHCVTQCRELEDTQKPVWFLEGMAEYFGTHQLVPSDAGEEPVLKFGVIPSSAEASRGFGRIEMIRDEVAAGNALSAREVMLLGSQDFAESRTIPYAWSWSLCTFLAHHPSTTVDFRTVCQQWETQRFHAELERLLLQHAGVISTDWEIFRNSLTYGFDLRRGATVQKEASEWKAGSIVTVDVQADQGWQSTGLNVSQNQTLTFTATGKVTLHETTKLWISEPGGISLRYAEKKPIGRLIGALRRRRPLATGTTRYWEFFDVGPHVSLPMPADGTLFLRINDSWNDLGNNSGAFQVTITDQK